MSANKCTIYWREYSTLKLNLKFINSKILFQKFLEELNQLHELPAQIAFFIVEVFVQLTGKRREKSFILVWWEIEGNLLTFRVTVVKC